ncbi:hypothetical protein [Ralstonia pseudosolanacearum]|uniref:hypothetical protein n=1 Tax=Ralstonia pseudosolanacearum TaxID=1310165 RepID=UPI003CEC57FF
MGGKLFFVLGAQDPEMREIEVALDSVAIPFAHASVDHRRCNAANAYKANSLVLLGRDGVNRPAVPPAGHEIVLVECALKGVGGGITIDHHNPGDSGFDASPDRYMDGSSLGQVLRFLHLEPNETQRLLAAADHCLTAAYQGLCPGVDPGELFFLRASWQAKLGNRSLVEVMSGIERAAKLVNQRYNRHTAEATFLDPTRVPRDLAEGGAYAGKAIRYRSLGEDFQMKEMLKGATPESIESFMAGHAAVGRRVYGNPHRGYAGAYL